MYMYITLSPILYYAQEQHRILEVGIRDRSQQQIRKVPAKLQEKGLGGLVIEATVNNNQ